jgi:nitrile hydratase
MTQVPSISYYRADGGNQWTGIMSHDHDHSHLSDTDLRVRALESLLTEKGLVDPAALDDIVDNYENKVGPRNGARVVAKAWTDPGFRKWLLADATAAIGSLGYVGTQGADLVVIENTPDVHNVTVCTLCSCYPWSVLGLPPAWYKSFPYRARLVKEPRAVLQEFGLELDTDVEVRVWDSTAELRYLVLPERPDGTENMTEEELVELVTRNSMIGTEKITATTGDA